MKINTKDLTGAALDWAVAKARGIDPKDIYFDGRRIYRKLPYIINGSSALPVTIRYQTGPEFLFSSMWEAGGPILEKEYISTAPVSRSLWHAQMEFAVAPHVQYGPTLLIAAMRCYVTFKLGDAVDIPEELCH